MENQPQNKNILKILWTNLVGEIREALQNRLFEGTIVALASSFGAMVFTAVVPAAAHLLIPMWKFLLMPTIGAIRKTYNMVARYRVHITPSGLAVLESPEILTPEKTVLRLPSKLALPSRDLIQPPPRLQATPELFSSEYTPLRSNEFPNTFQPGLLQERGLNTVTPFGELLSRAIPQSSSFAQNPRFSFNASQALNRYSSLRSLNEVEYPGWALNGLSTAASQQAPTPRPEPARIGKRDELLNWFMSDRSRAAELKSCIRELSQETDGDDRRYFECVLDNIYNWPD
jgi:hypothetical protein